MTNSSHVESRPGENKMSDSAKRPTDNEKIDG